MSYNFEHGRVLWVFLRIVRSSKLQSESSPNFSNFRPEFFPNFAPNFPRFFEEFSCFFLWETETRKNLPKIPAIFQCKIPRQIGRKNPQHFSGERSKREWIPANRPDSRCELPGHPRKGAQRQTFGAGYHGAQNDYTHIFIVWELISQLHRTSVTQGFLAGILLCNSAPS